MEREIGKEIRKAHRGIEHYFKNNEDFSLPRMPFFVLGYIKRSAGQVYLKDIENEFHINHSSAVEFIDKLENSGYVARIPDIGDGRKKALCLTQKANKLYVEMERKKEKVEIIMKQNITEKELDIFYSVLDKICSNLEGSC